MSLPDIDLSKCRVGKYLYNLNDDVYVIKTRLDDQSGFLLQSRNDGSMIFCYYNGHTSYGEYLFPYPVKVIKK